MISRKMTGRQTVLRSSTRISIFSVDRDAQRFEVCRKQHVSGRQMCGTFRSDNGLFKAFLPEAQHTKPMLRNRIQGVRCTRQKNWLLCFIEAIRPYQ